MFQITMLDHIRLTFGQVVHRHKAHAQAAERLSRRLRLLQIVELVLLAGTAASGVAAVLILDAPFVPLTAAVASLSLVTYSLTMALQLESRVYAHRWCAVRLWLIREKYYALLSELADDLIDLDAARARRDVLMEELHAVYRQAPLVDRLAYQSARDALKASEEVALSDEEIDRFLPRSLRKASSGVTAETPAGVASTPGGVADHSRV